MLTDKESAFLKYWEQERERQANIGFKIKSGLPKALLFYFPVPIFVFLVYIFSPDWFYRVSNKAGSLMPTILVALLLAAFFFAVFRMHFRWEANEVYYQELKQKEGKMKGEEMSVGREK
jgi:positive regulator of sigma E activity